MPDVVNLGRRVKSKYPGLYDDLPDGEVGMRVKAKYPGAYDDFTDTTYTPPQRSILDSIGGGLAQAGGDLVSSATAIAGALGSAAGGDFRPAKELAESAVRGAAPIVAALGRPDAGPRYVAESAAQAKPLAELQRRRLEREAQTPAGRYIQQRNAQLAAEAEQDTSRTAKIARGAGRLIGAAAPAVVTGVLSGGSIPAMAVTTAAQSAGQPEAIVPSAILGAAPVPVGDAFRAGINAVRRAFGKGAAQIIEAEALPAATAQARQTIGGGSPPTQPGSMRVTVRPPIGPGGVGDLPPSHGLPALEAEIAAPISGQASPTVQTAIQRFEEAVQRINAMNVSPNIKAAEMKAAIAEIGREARGIPPSPPGESMVQSQYPRRANFGESLPMVMPDNPNPIQRAGALPGGVEPGPPVLEADLGPHQFGVRAAGEAPFAETGGPLVQEAQEMALRGASASVIGPSASAPMGLNAAITQAAQSVPKPLSKRIVDELAALYHLPKSLKSSIDISAPFRQGSLLTIPPTQWGRAARAGVRMFQAFSTRQFDRIKQEIASHVDAGVADDAGLYLVTKAGQTLQGAEEAFLSKYGGRIPLVKQSQQAYETYLDSLRMDTFAKYKKVIDGSGLSPEQAQNAYRAAATWINYATGRGSLGQKIDQAMPALNGLLFSPRYVASRLNVLNPVYYARNAATAEGRVVLKQQMAELVQYAGMVAGTMALAKAAGADVGLNPGSSDFLKIRAGNWRYDVLAGLQQVMRLFYRSGAAITRQARGEKSRPGEGFLDVAGSFLRSKLAPVPAVFTDFVKGRTVTGKEFSGGKAVADLIAPIQWADFVEAYQKEGFGGVAAATPGLVGFGAQLYEPKPVDAAIERAQPLFTELNRLNKRVSDLRKKEGEKDDAFNARVQQFGQNYTLYGLRLLESPRFQAAPDNIKALALDALNSRAKATTSREFAFPELELDANSLLDAAESSKKNPAKR